MAGRFLKIAAGVGLFNGFLQFMIGTGFLNIFLPVSGQNTATFFGQAGGPLGGWCSSVTIYGVNGCSTAFIIGAALSSLLIFGNWMFAVMGVLMFMVEISAFYGDLQMAQVPSAVSIQLVFILSLSFLLAVLVAQSGRYMD